MSNMGELKNRASNFKYIVKIISIIIIILLTISIIITYYSPDTRYESSIYNKTPIILWISIILSIAFGIFFVLLSIYNNKVYSKYWLYGFFLVFFAYITCISLYIIKGYYLWDIIGDVSSHVGYIKQIINAEKIPERLVYPIMHIYSTEIFYAANIDLGFVQKIIPLILGILFIPFMYILSRLVLNHKWQAIITGVISCAFIYSYNMTLSPNVLSNLLFPLVLYVFIKYITTNNFNWFLLSVILICFYPPLHIIPTIALALILTTVGISDDIFLKYKRITYDKKIKLNVIVILLLVIVSIIWVSSIDLWKKPIIIVYETIADINAGPAQLSMLGDTADLAKELGYNPWVYAIKQQGTGLLIIILAFIALPIAYINSYKNKTMYMFTSMYAPLIILSFLVVILYILSDLGFSPLRILVYIIIISTIMSGYLLWTIIDILKNEDKVWLSIVALSAIFILLMVIFTNGVFTLYPSPYTGISSYQTTHFEETGMHWFLEKRSIKANLITNEYGSMGIARRYTAYFNDPIMEKNYLYLNVIKTPYHFGYYSNNNSTMNDENLTSIKNKNYQNTYVLITPQDKTKYTDIFPRAAKYRFTSGDFDLLKIDSNINRIYSNDEFDLWVVK